MPGGRPEGPVPTGYLCSFLLYRGSWRGGVSVA